jgi:hypothetical protein
MSRELALEAGVLFAQLGSIPEVVAAERSLRNVHVQSGSPRPNRRGVFLCPNNTLARMQIVAKRAWNNVI